MGKYKRGIIIPDPHVPLHDEAAVKCVLKAIELTKPNIAVFLGDVGEWDSVSSWKYKKKKRPPVEYIIQDIKSDEEVVNFFLDRFDKTFAKIKLTEKYFLMGNHEVWLDNFVEEHPYLKKYLPQNVMRLKERKYKWYSYGKYMSIGKLHFYHGGHHTGVYHARHHVINLGVNVMYGHNHSVSRECITRLDGVHAGFCVGCLKECHSDSNKWLKGRNVNWGQCFAIVDWNEDGTFRADIIDITDGRTFLWGKLIDGGK
jgi:hypothetical protein